MTNEKPRLLCVDDERNVLDALRRTLLRQFDVTTAASGSAGLDVLDEQPPFAVVMSDLRMPEMDGIEFLARVRSAAPEAVRVLLTGNADLTAAIAAVNEGNIFRFLSKPCPAATLVSAIAAAAEQHRLITAERVLLERTLVGSVKMLTEVLALAHPTAFGRAARIKDRAAAVAEELGEPDRWKMEMAAMLSQVAHVTLPLETLRRLSNGDDLTPGDRQMESRLPEVAESLLVDIPRIEDVRAILRNQDQPFAEDGAGPDDVPRGARILKAVLDLDVIESQDVPTQRALETLSGRAGMYDPSVLLALKIVSRATENANEIRLLSLSELREGMVLIDPVESVDGRLLVAHGQQVSLGLIERLENFSKHMKLKEPLRVVVSKGRHAVSSPPPE